MTLLRKIQRPLGILTLLLLVVGVWLVFTAPMDYQQNNAVRIMYIHVPSAHMALLMYVVLAATSGFYLWKKSETADVLAESAASVGAIFSAVTLASGSIWGKPLWGSWWEWDTRMTSMLVMLILYIGLMALRHALDDPRKSAQATAVLAIIGAADVPIIHFAIELSRGRTLHQPNFDMSTKASVVGGLLPPLLVMIAAFTLMGGYLWILKAREVATRRQLVLLEAERTDLA